MGIMNDEYSYETRINLMNLTRMIEFNQATWFDYFEKTKLVLEYEDRLNERKKHERQSEKTGAEGEKAPKPDRTIERTSGQPGSDALRAFKTQVQARLRNDFSG